MRRYLTWFFILYNLLLNAQSPTGAFDYTIFKLPDKGFYMDMYFKFDGTSFLPKELSSTTYEFGAEFILHIAQDDKTIYSTKKILRSGVLYSDDAEKFDFYHNERITLEQGSYLMEFWVSDLIANADKSDKKKQYLYFNDSIFVDFPANKIVVSSPDLIEKVSKSSIPHSIRRGGLYMKPMVENYTDADVINFYTEIYNTEAILGKNAKFVLKYYIRNIESLEPEPSFYVIKPTNTSEIIPLLTSFDITNLPKGDYLVVVEVADKDNNILCSASKYFRKSSQSSTGELMAMVSEIDVRNTWLNKVNSKDTLIEWIRCLRPITNRGEVLYQDNVIRSGDIDLMKTYILGFWMEKNKKNPEGEWRRYKEQVDRVEVTYGSKLLKGYETDRGRVFLQYGPPNTVTQRYNEPSAYPYEIWHYYEINKQTNRRFVFYNPEISTNIFVLLHSDAIGEFNNPRWQIMLHSRNNITNNPDQQRVIPHWGSMSNDLFINPR